MGKELILQTSINIIAPASKVWEALTCPGLIKKYLFNTEVVTDWKAGSPITYKGIWDGRKFTDEGTIIIFEPEKIFQYTYWSTNHGTGNTPENYVTITYTLSQEGNRTLVSITQDNFSTIGRQKHMREVWKIILHNLKKLVEETKSEQ